MDVKILWNLSISRFEGGTVFPLIQLSVAMRDAEFNNRDGDGLF